MQIRALPLVAFLAVGCASAPKTNVRTIPDTREAIPEGQALIVFVRPDHYGPGQPAFVVDDKGKLIGEIPAESRLHVFVPAGKHTFVAWHHAVFGDYGQSSLVTGEVQAGRAYLVQMGYWEVPMQLISIPLAVPNCGRIEKVLEAKRVAVDPQGRLDPAKTRQMIDEAIERHRDAKDDGAAFFWTFHNRGGTWEKFFTANADLTALGPGGLCESMRGGAQREIDMDAWEKYLDSQRGIDFEWVEKKD